MAIKINIDFKKKPSTEATKPIAKPVNPLWNTGYSTVPVLKKPVIPQAETRPLNIPMANRLQNLKEPSLDRAVVPQLKRPLSNRLQEDFGQIDYRAPQGKLETTALGVAKGIQDAFGGNALRSPQEKQILQDAAQTKGITIPAVKGGGLSGRLAEDFGQTQDREAMDISALDIGSGVGRLSGEAFKYAALAPILAGSKVGQAIMNVAGKSKTGQFLGKQAIDLFSDAVIQAPTEIMESIENDDTLEQFSKKYATNRALDALLNGVIGMSAEALKGAVSTPSAKQALEEIGVTVDDVIASAKAGDTEAIKNIQNKINIKGKEYEVSKGTAQGSIPIAETKPSLTLPSGQKVVRPEFELKKPTENLYTKTEPKTVFSIDDRSITNVGKTNIKPYAEQNAEVKQYFVDGAKDLKADLAQTVKGQQSGGLVRVDDGRGGFTDRYVDTSTSRESSETMKELLETLPSRPSYKELDESFDRIISGKPLNALDKQVETIIDKRLSKGYRLQSGEFVKPDQGYVRAKALGEFEATAPPIKIESPLTKRTLTQIPTTTVKKELPRIEPKPITRVASMSAEGNKGDVYKIDKGVAPKPLKRVDGVEPKPLETPKTQEELVGSFESKVKSDIPKKKVKPFKEKLFQARKEFEDDLLEFERLEKNVTGKVASAENSIYKTTRLYKGAPEKANEFIRTKLAPVIDRVVAKGNTQDELSNYALAVHAKDVNNMGKRNLFEAESRKNALEEKLASGVSTEKEFAKLKNEIKQAKEDIANAKQLRSGMSDDEIDAVIKKYGTPELEQARKELVQVSNNALDELVASGRISQESVDAMRKKWPNYMPLSRNFDDDKVDFTQALGGAFSNVSNPISKLKGSDREIIDPIDSMVKNIYRIIDSSEKNKVGVQLAKLADVADDSVIRKLDDNELIDRKNVVTVYVDGKKQRYEVEPEVFKAFNGLDKESSNWLINMLSKPASALRAGATLTPEFALRNPFRDIQTAYITSESGFTPFDFVAGLASTLKKDDLYSKFLKEGGGYGNMISMDRQAHKEALENALKQPLSKKFVNVLTPKGFMSLLRSISDVTESATKVGEFKAALRSGATPQEAAFRAKDTMDFSRAGYSIRQTNKIVAFLNSSIQGKSKLIRAIKKNPAGVTARIAKSIVIPTVAISAFSELAGSEEQKKTIKDAPDWLKNSFWLIPVPGTDVVARFPKPFDVSVFANTTERFIDYLAKNDKEAFDGFVKSTLKDLSIPIGITGLVPLVEGMTNYSFFREGPIIPRAEEGRLKKDQYDSKTSHIGKALAGVAGMFNEDSNFASPRVMDHILKTTGAGLGQYAIDSTDFLINGIESAVTGKKAIEKPSPRIENLPVIKAFTVSPQTSGKSVEYVYNIKDKLTKQKASSKFNKLAFNYQSQQLLDYANEKTKLMGDISKKIKEIEQSGALARQKRDEIVRLTKERNQIAQESADYIKQRYAK